MRVLPRPPLFKERISFAMFAWYRVVLKGWVPLLFDMITGFKIETPNDFTKPFSGFCFDCFGCCPEALQSYQ